MTTDDSAPKEPTVEIPVVNHSVNERVFDTVSKWMGLVVLAVALYYDLELERDVSVVIYGIGGALAGLTSVLKQLKP